ncbi:hypothetical protein HD554DRAFT_2175853 [Boletus coccyginus]|nr:hypothetical protein HD554DRAFT_2175853 [Boletus coccyginus]
MPSMDENEEIVIASIRATDVALGLGRFPAGFYTTVRHSGLEWRTENKRSTATDDVVEWNGPIPVPSDLSATVCIEVYASFELQSMLGAGEQLRGLRVTVEQLLDCSAKDVPFSFLPQDGDAVSSCSSILVTVKRRRSESSDSPLSTVLGPRCSTTISRDELEDATDQGHRALSRYRKHGEQQDLERSTFLENTDTSFKAPLSLYRSALAARPVGHVDRPSTLIQLAAVHFARFEKERDEVESARAEALLHEAIELGSTDSHENQSAALMLQLHAGRRVGPRTVRADDESSVERESTARLTDEDPWTSSVQLMNRFEQFGDLADLQKAITVLKELVRSTSAGDDRYRGVLGNLGVALSHRFNHMGELSDLEEAISTLRDAINIPPHAHPDKPDYLKSLGSFFLARFERLGELSDLEGGISVLRDAINLTPHAHPSKPGYLNNLGGFCLARFERLGELSDLESGISVLREAVELAPRGPPDKPGYLNTLGNSFKVCFNRLEELSDIEDAISTLCDAVELTPCGHPHKPRRVNNLGSSYVVRFQLIGKPSDLEDGILALRHAVELTPDGHPDKPGHLNNLGNSFTIRFEHLGQPSDLEDAISTRRHAVDLTPHGHPQKPSFLYNLGNSFFIRFERLGELGDLEDAISRHRNAVDLTPHGHPGKPGYLNSLGISFFARFEHLGELSDLEDSISTLRDAVDLTPHLDPSGRTDSLETLPA